MKLRDQIAFILAEWGPMTLPALCLSLQEFAGIEPLTTADLKGDEIARARGSSPLKAKKLEEEVRQRLHERYELMVERGYTIQGIHRILVSGDFDMGYGEDGQALWRNKA